MMAAGIDESPEADGAGTKAEHLVAVRFLLNLGVYDIDATANDEDTDHSPVRPRRLAAPLGPATSASPPEGWTRSV